MRYQLIALAMLVSGCGQGNRSPDQEGMTAALRAYFTQAAVVQAVPDGKCQPGKVGDRTVQVCDYCVLWVGADLGPQVLEARTGNVVRFLDHFTAHKGRYQATFARAISYSQPMAEPEGGEGVWVVVGSPPAPDVAQKESKSALSDEQAATLGVQIFRQRHYFSTTVTAVVAGSVVNPYAALDQFEKPESVTAIEGLVGSCISGKTETA